MTSDSAIVNLDLESGGSGHPRTVHLRLLWLAPTIQSTAMEQSTALTLTTSNLPSQYLSI